MPTRSKKPLGKDAARKPARPGHGGPRKGAGRPRGVAKGRSAAIANEIIAGIRFVEEGHDGTELPKDATPLDVMMMAMRKAYKLGGSLAAAPYAEKCAPYIHARLATAELKNADNKPFTIAFKWVDE